ncbi:MAG: arylsulfatase [Verrucomicrobiae bacterium]|nr:arylsulfatase [Verrucomicrobiae bacterium]
MALLAAVGLLIPCHGTAPSLVVILADDLGWGDLGCYNPDSRIPTPHLDRLASEGMRFTDAHSPSAVCTPTRYGLLTGRYSWRTRLKQGVLWGYSPPLIEPDRPTIASHLRTAGYATAGIGKWHLGLGWISREPASFGDGPAPMADPALVDFSQRADAGAHTVGFDFSYLLPASLDMEPYVFLADGRVTGIPSRRIPASRSQRHGGDGFWREGPASSDFTHEGVESNFLAQATGFLLQQSPDHSFLLYLALASPHDPWVPRPEFRGRSRAGIRGDFVAQMDDTVGRLLRVLDETGRSTNTVVLFTSDNGAHWLPDEVAQTGHRANGPWRGMKADAFEGGHRVPLLVRWPGVVRAGSTSGALIGLNDLFATAAEIAGTPVAPGSAPDSVSFLPVLRGDVVGVRDSLVLHSIHGTFALREGDWKLIEGSGSGGWSPGEDAHPVQLFHLREDPGETNNLAAAESQRVAALRSRLDVLRTGARQPSTPTPADHPP